MSLTKYCKKVVFSQLSNLTIYRRLPVNFHSLNFSCSPGIDSRFLFPEFRNGYDELFWIAENFLSDDMIVWDFGAQVGMFTLCSATKSKKVYSVEANPIIFTFLNYNKQLHAQLSHKITAINAAISSTEDIIHLEIPNNGIARSHIDKVSGNNPDSSSNKISVVSVSMDWLSKQIPAPDFVKIDVEGAESLLFKGSLNFFEENRPIVYVEVSEENIDFCTKFLHNLGYKLYYVSDGELVSTEQCKFNTLALFK